MKKVKKIGIVVILLGFCAVAANIIYLFTLTPKEEFPEDTYLKNEPNKTALIIVAHDDDALVFSGTTALLAANGWDISFMCFYTDQYRPEDNRTRKLEMQKVLEIEGLKNLELIDFTITKSLETINNPWMPIPYDEFQEKLEVDSLKMYVLKAIKKYNPSVIFTLDNEIGFYGNPEHVLVGQVAVEICSLYKDSSNFSVKKIYHGVFPYSQAEKIMGKGKVYTEGKKIYGCNGMPTPDVQINISSFTTIKKKIFLAHASQHRNLKKFYPFYHYYPGWLYFGIFNKEYFRIISFEEL